MTYPTGRMIAAIKDASASDMSIMLCDIGVDDDGRSNWKWFRLSSGDLIFGCYPQGDTYERVANQEGMI